MGTWSTEPFGNDDAADWAFEADDSDDAAAFVRETLLAATEHGATDELAGNCAIAAAAWLDAGAQLIPYGPETAAPALTIELRDLAGQALERVLAPTSRWLATWNNGDREAAAANLRALLERLRSRQP